MRGLVAGRAIYKEVMTLFGFAATCIFPKCSRREAEQAKREWCGGGHLSDKSKGQDGESPGRLSPLAPFHQMLALLAGEYRP